MKLFHQLQSAVAECNIYAIHKELEHIHASHVKLNNFYYENIYIKKFISSLHEHNLLRSVLPEYVNSYLLLPNIPEEVKKDYHNRLSSVLFSLFDARTNIPIPVVEKTLEHFSSDLSGHPSWYLPLSFNTSLDRLVRRPDSIQILHNYQVFAYLAKEEMIGKIAMDILFMSKHVCPQKSEYLQALYNQEPTYFLCSYFAIGTEENVNLAEKAGMAAQAEREFISFYQLSSHADKISIKQNIQSLHSYFVSRLKERKAITFPGIKGYVNYAYKTMLENAAKSYRKIQSIDSYHTINQEINKQPQDKKDEDTHAQKLILK